MRKLSSRTRPSLYLRYGQWEDVKIIPLPVVFARLWAKDRKTPPPIFQCDYSNSDDLSYFLKKYSPAVHAPALLKGFGTCIHPRPKPNHSLYLLFQNRMSLTVEPVSALLRALIMVFIHRCSKQPLEDLCPVFSPVRKHHYPACYFRAQIHWNRADCDFQSKPILICWPIEKSHASSVFCSKFPVK